MTKSQNIKSNTPTIQSYAAKALMKKYAKSHVAIQIRPVTAIMI